jgi:hypothetical protein
MPSGSGSLTRNEPENGSRQSMIRAEGLEASGMRMNFSENIEACLPLARMRKKSFRPKHENLFSADSI